MIHADFVHLHLHTQYSLLDGAIRLRELMQMAQAQRAPALAITDHGNMFGAIEFYNQAQRAGIKPIIGCEVYLAPESRFDKNSRGIAEASFHLILLAKNLAGYANLIKLTTAGYLEGFYYRPRIDKELLSQHAAGLIALSACLKGEIPHYLSLGEKRKAREAAGQYRDIFGDRFYLEVQENGIAEQSRANAGLLEIGRELSIPLVATNDCHYLRREEARAHDILLCIQTGKTVNSPERLKFATDQFYLRDAEEMKELFAWHPEAVKNSLAVAERCNLELDFRGYHLPVYLVPEGHSLESYLEEKARDGLENRFSAPGLKEEEKGGYRERLEQELRTIKSMGLAGYLLIVADFINYAKGQRIPVGPGRGSAAGSLVAYALRITEVDPIAQNLLFERFLNEGRKSLPDIDVDFCIDRREEVIRYVAEKYGADRVAQITTFGTMQARAVIRDVGRALDMPYNEVDRIAKLIPPSLNITLDEALAQEPRLRQMEKENDQIKNLLDVARSLEGLTRHASTHAAGVVISDALLANYTPLYKGPKGEILTQYDMGSLEKIGLVKFDFLSLKTLTVIDKTVKILKESRGIDLDLSQVKTDDKKTFKTLRAGDANGVFQLEGRGIKELMVKLKPDKLEDITALIALYRPGPLQSGMAEDFIQRKLGKVPIEYEVPHLREILKETYGVILYQEQVMKIATELADFTPEEADLLRYAMGKKAPEEMNRQKELFVRGAKKKGISERKAGRIFDLMAHFAGYGFNKSHSAAYAVISFQTAYLKAHYLVEFMAALLSSEKENSDKVMRYIGECREKGVDVLPPDVSESLSDFTVLGGKIRFGLAAVKNVGAGAIEAILEARKEGGNFSSFSDFCQRVDLRKINRRVLESLIKAGAFDVLEPSRGQLLQEMKETMDGAIQKQREQAQGQFNLFAGPEAPKSLLLERKSEEDSSELKLAYEKEALGLYLTDHPLRPYLSLLSSLDTTPISEMGEKGDSSQVKVGGLVSNLKQKVTKKGQLMAFFNLEDLTGKVEVLVFSDLYKEVASLLEGNRPVVVQGILDVGEEGIKLKATKVLPLTETRKGLASVHLRLKGGVLSREALRSLKEVLSRYPGGSPAYLHLSLEEGKEALIKLPESLSPSEELAKELCALFGPEVVAFEDSPEE